MEQIAHIEQPGVLARTFFRIGERMFVQVIIGFQTFASKFAKAWRLAPQGYSSSRPGLDAEG